MATRERRRARASTDREGDARLAIVIDARLAVERHSSGDQMNVLVTTEFKDALLDRMRAVSPDVRVARDESGRTDYAGIDVLYGNALPRDPARVPQLQWVQLHMAGPDSIHGHPIYTKTDIALTTTSGVHAATVAEYAITVLLALAHRVPRMVEWKRKG